MTLEKYSNFCPVPWTQFATSTDGFQRMCCMMKPINSITHGWYIYDSGKQLKAVSGLDSYINSDSTEIIKQQILKNIGPEQCRCYFNEKIIESNDQSKRVSMLGKYGIYTDSDVEKFIAKDHKIHYFDIRLGNLCNLQCLMCYGGLSNQLYEQSLYTINSDRMELESGFFIKKVNGEVVFDKNDEQRIFGWADSKFFADLENHIVAAFKEDPDQFFEFYFIGGEPLLNKPHFDFLNKMVALKYNDRIKLEYNTNLTVLNMDILNLWTKFEGITLAISIDDIGQRYEYIRYPAKWEKIESNLSDIRLFIDKHSNVFRTVNVVSVINIFTADNHTNLVKAMNSYGFDVYKLISHDPTGTTPRALSEEEKERFIDLIPRDSHYNDLRNYILSFKYNSAEKDHLKRMIKFWDSKRRTKFVDTYPALANIIYS